MRTWVEKLAKAIKEQGIVVNSLYIFGNCIRVQNFECKLIQGGSKKLLEIINNTNNTCSDIKLYEDECDVLEKAITYCINNSQDNFIKQLENL